MKLESELEPILRQIDTEAKLRWEQYLGSVPAQHQESDPGTWRKAGAHFDGTVEDLLARFRSYYAFDSHDFEQNVRQLADSATGFPSGRAKQVGIDGTAIVCIASAKDDHMYEVSSLVHTNAWRSADAQRFHSYILKPFGTASQWQTAYVGELAIAAASFQAACNRCKRAIVFVAQGCLRALRGQPELSQAALDFQDTSRDLPGADAMDSVGIVTGVAGFFLKGWLGTIMNAIGLASGIYGKLRTGGTEPDLAIAGTYSLDDSPQSIIDRTDQAIRNLREWLDIQDKDIAKRLDDDFHHLFYSSNLTMVPDVDDDSFGKISGIGQIVIESVIDLGRAGTYNLPAAANDYDLAARHVARCHVPGSLSQYFPAALGPFNSAADHLRQILRDTSDRLREAGEDMVTAVRNYQATDDERAEIMARIAQGAPSPRTIAPTK